MKHNSIYFYGNKVSDYGIERKRVDYATLAKCFDAVLANDIITKTDGVCGYWQEVGGYDWYAEEIEELENKIDEIDIELFQLEEEEEEKAEELQEKIRELQDELEELRDYTPEIYQYYIVSDNAVEILEEANEIVYYNEDLDLYVWGVTHWGTSWDYVLTDIKLDI